MPPELPLLHNTIKYPTILIRYGFRSMNDGDNRTSGFGYPLTLNPQRPSLYLVSVSNGFCGIILENVSMKCMPGCLIPYQTEK